MAPLLIHGALAALGLVIGGAIYLHRGRQIFFRSWGLELKFGAEKPFPAAQAFQPVPARSL